VLAVVVLCLSFIFHSLYYSFLIYHLSFLTSHLTLYLTVNVTAVAFAAATACGDKEGDRLDWLALPDYLTVAPEIVKGEESVAYGKPADVWAVGVLLFLMLTGTAPFDLREEGE
jgi:hypothetical protein